MTQDARVVHVSMSNNTHVMSHNSRPFRSAVAVQTLLQAGCMVNAPDGITGETVLDIAARRGHAAVVKVCLAAGATPRGAGRLLNNDALPGGSASAVAVTQGAAERKGAGVTHRNGATQRTSTGLHD